MKTILLALVVVAGFAGFTPASAANAGLSHYWLKLCSSEKKTQKLICYSFIRGFNGGAKMGSSLTVMNTITRVGMSKGYKSIDDALSDSLRLTTGCQPKRVSIDQIRKNWVKYLNAHNDDLNLPPADTLSRAYRWAFPCK